jgi:hypothetical protein
MITEICDDGTHLFDGQEGALRAVSTGESIPVVRLSNEPINLCQGRAYARWRRSNPDLAQVLMDFVS